MSIYSRPALERSNRPHPAVKLREVYFLWSMKCGVDFADAYIPAYTEKSKHPQIITFNTKNFCKGDVLSI